jgi:hypothetical protein
VVRAARGNPKLGSRCPNSSIPPTSCSGIGESFRDEKAGWCCSGHEKAMHGPLPGGILMRANRTLVTSTLDFNAWMIENP